MNKKHLAIFLSLFIFLRWPPPSDSNENQSQDSFIEFKMRQQQQQRKITPQYQEYNQGEGEPSTEGGVEWEEFEIENIVETNEKQAGHAPPPVTKHENGYKEEGEKKKKKSKYDRNCELRID